MSRLASQWKVVLAITVVAGIAIFAFEPDYNNLQTADNADAFRALLGDNQMRATAAAVSDLIFAAGYGVLGIVAFRALGSGRTAFVGLLAAVGAAIVDEIENVLVVINLSRAETVSDGWIDAMVGVGMVKWALIAIAFALAAVLLVRRMRERRTS